MQAKTTVKSFGGSDGAESPGGTSKDIKESLLARGPNTSVEPDAESWTHQKALVQVVVEAVEHGLPLEEAARLEEVVVRSHFGTFRRT